VTKIQRCVNILQICVFLQEKVYDKDNYFNHVMNSRRDILGCDAV